MRVNVIGTYNALEAAVATQRHARARSSSSRRARSSASTPSTCRKGTSRRSARSARRAGRTPSRSSPASTWRTRTTPSSASRASRCGRSTSTARARSAAGRSAPSSRPRSPAATSRSTATARRSAPGATSTTWSRRSCSRSSTPRAVGESFNVGNARSAVTIYDLATRIKRLTGCPGEIRFVPLDYTDVELRIPNVQKARVAARLRGARRARRGARAHDRLVSRPARRARVTPDPIRLARPDVGEAELAAVAEVLATGQLTMGPQVAAFEQALAQAVGTARRGRGLVRDGGAPPRDARARDRRRATR